MKYYDFVDKKPPIGNLVIIEGEERALADRALDIAIERTLPADLREMNLERFSALQLDGTGRVREAVMAMPFLASCRVVVVSEAQTLKAQQRRDLAEVMQEVPEGNTLVIADLLSPRSQRLQPLAALAPRGTLRIDTTANADVRARFIRETLDHLGVKAEPRAFAALAQGSGDLAGIRNDLEKLALNGKTVTLEDLERESLSIEDPKAYKYAGALVEGRIAEALAIAREMFASDRSAAVPLIYAVATECQYVWELAREGGEIPARMRWRERTLRPIAGRWGERRARWAFDRAIGAFDAVVTGKIDDAEVAVDLLSADIASLRFR